MVPVRDATFAEEAARQAGREQLRKDWAAASSAAQAWITAKLEVVKKEIEGAAFEKLEDEVISLNAVQADCTAYAPTLDALEKLHQQIQDSLIFENPHSHLSIEVLLRCSFSRVVLCAALHGNPGKSS
jgi:hypothetical protein